MTAAVPELLRAVIDALPDGVLVHEPRGGIVYANAAFRTLVGASDDPLGRPAFDFVHPDDRARVRERIQVAIAAGKPLGARAIRFLHRDGSVLDVEAHGVAYRPGPGDNDLIIVVVRDLAERRSAERALEQSSALFRTLIQDLPIGVLVQGPSAEILVSNRAALDLLGLDEAQLLGKTSFDPEWNVIHEDGSPFLGPEHPVPTAIRTARPARDVVMGVYRPRRKDRVWLLVNAEPQLDAQGHVVQVVCTFSDFTERRRLQVQISAGDRLASMGRLAASVAHGINNPLAYVLGNLEALRDAPLDPELKPKVTDALEGASRVRAIVDDLRSLSRGDDERRGPVDLHRVALAAFNIARGHVRHHARLVHELLPVRSVQGNESHLGQLVLNLIMNAADAIPEGRAAQNEIRVTVRPGAGDVVVLEVRDTGAGIPAGVLDHIFDPFFTTKPVGLGTGLGLSICHGIVKALGGTIAVESKVGEGSTFRVTLPVGEVSATVARAPAPAPIIPRLRILVVDDEPTLANLLSMRLARAHDVTVELSAARALQRVRAGERFDVIFCDLMMPDVTGMDLQEALEADASEMAKRTLFMSGGAFTPRAQAFLERHPERSLEKPFTMEEMDRAIARVVGIDEK